MVLWVPGKVHGLNDLVRAKAARVKGAPPGVVYNSMKREVEERVVLCARSQRFKPRGHHFNYLLVEQNMRRDPSNVAAGAIKMIEDALVRAKLLDNDGWKQVGGGTWYPHCEETFEPGVCLVVQDCPVLSKEAMIGKLQAFLLRGCVNH